MSPTALRDYVSLNRQFLVDAAVELQDDTDPLPDAIREQQHSRNGHTGVELYALLRAACWRDPDTLAGHIAGIAEAVRRIEAHGLVDGHDHCCGGECSCYGRGRRCVDCESRPNDLLEHEVDQLLHFLREAVGQTAVDQYLQVA